MANSITVKQREAKTISLTLSGTSSLAGATFQFRVKAKKSDSAYIILKEDSSFDKTDIADRIITFKLSTSDLDQIPMMYVSELKIIFDADNVDKSKDIKFEIRETV